MDYCIMKTDFGFDNAFWGKAKRLKGKGEGGQDLWGYFGCPQQRGVGAEKRTFMASFTTEDYNWHRKLQFGKWHKHPTERYSIKRFKDFNEFIAEVQQQLCKLLEGAKNLKDSDECKYLVITNPYSCNPVSVVSNLQEDENTKLSDVYYDIHNRGVKHNLILKAERDKMFVAPPGYSHGGTKADLIEALEANMCEIRMYIINACGFIFIPYDVVFPPTPS